MVECWQTQVFCGMQNRIWDFISLFWESQFGLFVPIMIWGTVVMVIWWKSNSPEIAGTIGVFISSGLLVTENSVWQYSRELGGLLLAISLGITLYQLFMGALFKNAR